MTDPVLIAIVAVIPATVASLAAFIVSVINTVKGSAVNRKADTLLEKTVEIHSLTNGTLTKVTNAHEVSMKEVDGLKQLVASMIAAKADADAALVERVKASPQLDTIQTTTEAIDHKVDVITERQTQRLKPPPE